MKRSLVVIGLRLWNNNTGEGEEHSRGGKGKEGWRKEQKIEDEDERQKWGGGIERGQRNCLDWLDFLHLYTYGKAVETSWFVKLKGLLASLSQSEISLKVDLVSVVKFNLDEIGNIETIHECQEVQELSLPIAYVFYAVPDGVSILNGLFLVCCPKNVNTFWIETSYKSEAMKIIYEMLMFRRIRDQFHYLQKTMHWQHELMEVNVEVFKSVISPIWDHVKFGKEVKKELQQKDLDWEDFLNVLRKKGTYFRLICFKLEWRTMI
ncbi:hypothetical protein ACH5RR_032974 [Cinchona calisaya]|uniref:Uncharacterized protein n=1 Tax=Cinchona calisaya TaxID=153742 RepID=A0ABD2YMT2_9GENT